MSLLSPVSCSSSSYLSSNCCRTKTTSPFLPIPTPLPTLKLLKFAGNANRISLRKCLKAKSSDRATDTSNNQLSPEDSGVAVDDNGASSSTATSFLSFLCPLLKLFSGGDPSQERSQILEVATSSLSSMARFLWGSRAVQENSDKLDISTSDPPHLQLFEFEACPFCRRVREALTELDLSAEVYPCPKGSLRHRAMVRKLGGKEQFPFLIDQSTGILMYESGDIVRYLYQQYGKGRSPSTGLLESTLLTGWVPTILRAGRGMTVWEKATIDPPLKKLELFSYENNPHARIVREALCELELPYVLQNVAAGSWRSKLLLDVSGLQRVPYLIDHNTGAHIGDYKEILAYLFRTYSTAAT